MTTTSIDLPISSSIVEKENDRCENVKNYSQFDYKYGTTWLAFRDVPSLIRKYVNGTESIDYGCGSGRSTRFLTSLGLRPTGLDISDKMLFEARSIDSATGGNHSYKKIKSGHIPFSDKTIDFIFSSFVFLVIPSKPKMTSILKDMHRVLKDDGVIIIATGSEKMHDPLRNWVSYETNFPENKSLHSGSLAKVRIKEVGAEFYDYNWLDADYKEVFENAGFSIEEKLCPLGTESDKCSWSDEVEHSPYYVYVLKKV